MIYFSAFIDSTGNVEIIAELYRKLLRRIGLSVNPEKWEKSLLKVSGWHPPLKMNFWATLVQQISKLFLCWVWGGGGFTHFFAIMNVMGAYHLHGTHVNSSWIIKGYTSFHLEYF